MSGIPTIIAIVKIKHYSKKDEKDVENISRVKDQPGQKELHRIGSSAEEKNQVCFKGKKGLAPVHLSIQRNDDGELIVFNHVFEDEEYLTLCDGQKMKEESVRLDKPVSFSIANVTFTYEPSPPPKSESKKSPVKKSQVQKSKEQLPPAEESLDESSQSEEEAKPSPKRSPKAKKNSNAKKSSGKASPKTKESIPLPITEESSQEPQLEEEDEEEEETKPTPKNSSKSKKSTARKNIKPRVEKTEESEQESEQEEQPAPKNKKKASTKRSKTVEPIKEEETSSEQESEPEAPVKPKKSLVSRKRTSKSKNIRVKEEGKENVSSGSNVIHVEGYKNRSGCIVATVLAPIKQAPKTVKEHDEGTRFVRSINAIEGKRNRTEVNYKESVLNKASSPANSPVKPVHKSKARRSVKATNTKPVENRRNSVEGSAADELPTSEEKQSFLRFGRSAEDVLKAKLTKTRSGAVKIK